MRLHVRRVVVGLAMALSMWVVSACGRGEPAAPAPSAPKAGDGRAAASAAAKPAAGAASAAVLLLSPEDLRTLALGALASGPVITGSIQPEKRADLRAEVSAVVVQVLKENGQAVRQGELLVRLDATAIRDALGSAEEAARASTQALEQIDRQVQRQKTLQAQGMSTNQALEDAEQRRNNAQSDLVAARSRVASARQQLQRTEVRAPFDGLLSDRKASVGDTAQMGKELVKVIDPGSLRFEGMVSADRMQELKIGQVVRFRVNGDAQSDFSGSIRRIDAVANAATRQVEVLVALTPGNAPRVAGLYAEGRVEVASRLVLLLPEAALQRSGDNAFVWQLQGQSLRKQAVKLGERDARTGDVPVLAGVAAGDVILRRPGSNLVDGQRVEMAGARGAPAAATSAASSGPAASTPTASAAAGRN